eukprot:1152132-Pelagomonas_calceolata.AAC.4
MDVGRGCFACRNYTAQITSSRPDTILVTASSRKRTIQRTIKAYRVRQPHQLLVNQQHLHSIIIKYCEDINPGQQLKTAQRQQTHSCKFILQTL